MDTDTVESPSAVTEQDSVTIIGSSSLGKVIKRILDLFVSGLGLLVLSPLFLATALRIKSESPGPILYRGFRVGMGGKVFKILKFRTMYERPESYNGAVITADNDTRVTPLGRKLRGSKINEIPQLWNVFKGEMSLVGPRPEDPSVAKTWSRDVFREILSVRPGMTSPASVIYRNEEKMLQSINVMDEYLRNILPDKQRLDLLYIRTRSLVSDIDIILQTLIAILPASKKSGISESKLYSGVLTNLYRRYVSWFFVDMLVAFLAAGLVGVIWRLSGPLDLGWEVALGVAMVMALIFSLVNILLGLGNVSWEKASPILVFDLGASTFLAMVIIFAGNWFWPSERLIPPGMVIEIAIMSLIGFIIVRYRQRLITGFATRWLQMRPRGGVLGERVLIVGAGDCGQLAGWLLMKSNLAGRINIVGIVDDDPMKRGMRIDGHLVLGTTRDLPTVIQKNNIGVILFAITQIKPDERERIMALCRSLPVRLVLIPDLIGILQKYFLAGNEMPEEE